MTVFFVAPQSTSEAIREAHQLYLHRCLQDVQALRPAVTQGMMQHLNGVFSDVDRELNAHMQRKEAIDHEEVCRSHLQSCMIVVAVMAARSRSLHVYNLF